jgi:NADH-quinone oxidoreductase subunit E
MTANWEFLDDMDVPRALEVVEKLQSGEEVFSTRGPRIGTFEEIERTLAGFEDGLAQEGGKDDRMLAGLTYANQNGMAAPASPAESPLKPAQTEG